MTLVEHDLSDRRFDLILERLDSDENFLRISKEFATLNESLQALAYAALGHQAPSVRRRHSA